MNKLVVLALIFIGLITLCAGTAKPAKAQVPDSWATMAPLPEPLLQAETAVVNGKIYVIGMHYNSSGNYDFVNNNVLWDAGTADHSLPNSLYLTAKPAFFGTLPWPWVDPAGATKTHTLPAKARFDAGLR